MQLHEVLQVINSKPKGSFITLLYTRPIKLKKSASQYNYGTKTTRCTIRTGISYVNTKAYRTKKAEEYNNLVHSYPTPEQLTTYINKTYQPLYWGEWYIPNLIIKHKKNGKNRYYLRCFPTINQSVTTYTLNGEVITKDQLKHLDICLAEEFRPNNEGCFTLNIEGIQKIY